MAFNNCFSNKKVLVTGNTGFKGSWLTTWLKQLGAQVVGISKDIPTNPSLFERLQLAEKVEQHYANILDVEAMKKIVGATKPDFVFHLAAQPIVSTAFENPIDTITTNVIGTGNVLEALMILKNPCKVVIITSDKCYDNVEWIWGYREQDALGGKDPYSASKGAAELIIKTYFHSYFNKPESNIKLVSVRAGNVIGGGDWAKNRIVPDCVRAWSKQQTVKIRNPESTRPWLLVLEPLSGYLRAAQILYEEKVSIHGEAFNFGPTADQTHNVLDLLKEISKHWKFDGLKEYFFIESIKAFPEAALLKLNCDKALAFLQWKPVLEFSQTTRFTGEWYDEYYHGNRDSMYDYTVAQIQAYTELAGQQSLAWVQ